MIEEKFNEIKKYCTGCAACLNSCPKNAISMNRDDKGILFPHVNPMKCVSCGRCIEICPQITSHGMSIHRNFVNRYFCATMKDQEKIKSSASGGVFVALSDFILESGGVIFGARMDNDAVVYHAKATNYDERNMLCGSKYLQSNIGFVYRDVANYLKQNSKVLFSGTPCQILGLLSCLKGSDITNLYTVDILCHGVPGNVLFMDYYKHLEKEKGQIREYCFRDRRFGMHGSNVHVFYMDGSEEANTERVNVFDRMYSRGYLMRESCFHCRYASSERCTDITIGDFWGIEKINGDWDTNKGASLISINSEKGLEIWNKVSDNMYWFETNYEECKQDSMYKPIVRPADYDFFWKVYGKKGYKTCVSLFFGETFISHLYKFVCRVKYKLMSILGDSYDR